MRQSACLVVNPITVNNFASLAGGPGVKLSDGPDLKLFIFVGWGRILFACCFAHRGSTVGFLLLQCSNGVVRYPRLQRSPDVGRSMLFLSSPHLCFIIVFIRDLFVSHDDPLMS